MANNFATVGVEAIVKGLRPFESNLNKMNDTVLETSDQISDLANVINDQLNQAMLESTKDAVMIAEAINHAGDKAGEFGQALPSTKTKTFGERLGNIVNIAANVATALVSVAKFLIDVGKAAFNAAVKVGKFLVGLGKASFDIAVEFESSFAGIKKTVDATDEEFALLEQSMRDLSKTVPVDVNTLNQIAELGGQLGVVNDETEDITGSLTSFTTTIAALAASTNLTTDAAATNLAQIANIMGTIAEEGDQAFSKMGSSVVALGNNFATNEADIVNFGGAIAGAGEIVGLTEANIFAIGAAMSSVKIPVQAGGTAVQKVLLAMDMAMRGTAESFVDNTKAMGTSEAKLGKLQQQLLLATVRQGEFTDKTKESTKLASQFKIDDLTKQIAEQDATLVNLISTHGMLEAGSGQLATFSKVAGVEAAKFQEMWEVDAAGAFQLFVEGLAKPGVDAVGVLDKLELKDQRLIKAFLSLTNAEGLLGEAIDLSNEAWKENTALAEEAEKRYETTESQIAIMKNTFKDIALTAGQTMLPMFNDMLIQAKPFIEQVGKWFEENLPSIMENVGGFIQGTLIPAFTELWNWLGANLPGAIATLGAFWNDTLLPAFLVVQEFIVGTLIPAFNNLVAFFESEGPGALETLSAVWDEVWGGIQSVAATFVAWFEENLPLIIETGQTLADFWENTLAPALESAWEVIKGIVDLALDNILGSITLIMQIINGDWEGAWETIKEIAVNTWENLKGIFANAIALIKPLVTTYVTWWLAKWQESFEKAKAIWETVKTAVTEWIEGIKQSLVTKMEEVKATWSAIWENIKLIASTIWTNITTAISTWFAGLGTETESKLTGIKEFWVGIWEGIKGIVAEKIAAIKETINNILTSLFAAMGLDLEEMKERWAIILGDIVAIATEIWTRIKNAIITRVTTLVTNLAILWATISAAVKVVWDAISLKISTVWTAISTAVTTKIEEIQTTLTTIWDAISTKVSEIWDAVSLKISEVWTAISLAVSTKIAEIRDTLGTIWDEISTKVGEVWGAIVSGVTTKLQEMFASVVTIVEAIKTWFGEQIEVWKAIGQAIIDGLVSGIKEKAGRLIDTVTGAVENAIDGAKKLLGMESPSKLFMEIGANTILGFIGGVNAMAPAAQGAMAQAVVPQQMVAGPQVMPQQNISVQVGPNTIASQIDQAAFENRVLQVVAGAIG